jgi:hypothetical protein
MYCPFSPNIVTFDWLMESLKTGCPASEEDFKFTVNAKELTSKEPQAPSPATKKNLESMNSTFKRPTIPPKLNLDLAPPEPAAPVKGTRSEDVLSMYLRENDSIQMPEVPRASSTLIEPSKNADPKARTPKGFSEDTEYTERLGTETQVDFLVGKTIFIFGFESEVGDAILKTAENAGACIVADKFRDFVDFIVLPAFVEEEPITSVQGHQKVNDFWMEDCEHENKCLPVSYFHKPTLCPPEVQKVLEGEIIVLSTYANNERTFLEELAGSMGAVCNSRLVKKESPIVVSPVAEGSKYDFAIKWNLSVVNANWLLKCLEERRRVDESPFLVGNAKPSSKNIGSPSRSDDFDFTKPSDVADMKSAPQSTRTRFSDVGEHVTTKKRISDIGDSSELPTNQDVQPCQSTDDLTLDRNDTEQQKENQDQEDSPLIIKNRRLMLLSKKRPEATVTSPLATPSVSKTTSTPVSPALPVTPTWSADTYENPLNITDKGKIVSDEQLELR